MAGEIAQTGHGVEVAVEIVGAAPAAFTIVGQLVTDQSPGPQARPAEESTPHNVDIDEYVPAGRLMREDMTIEVNYDDTGDTHGESTGFYGLLHAGTKHGLRFRGPGGSAGVNELIMSGFTTNVDQSNPVREGIRSETVTFRPSGLMIMDGTVITGTISP